MGGGRKSSLNPILVGSVELAGVHNFSGGKILWVGTSPDSQELMARLHQELNDHLERCSVPVIKEQRGSSTTADWVPHVTLFKGGMARHGRNKASKQKRFLVYFFFF